MKISELEGNALNWAVAKCLGIELQLTKGKWYVFDTEEHPEFANGWNDNTLQMFNPMNDWLLGGRIIEREGISLTYENGDWYAKLQGNPTTYFSYLPLVSAMRCYVASRVGDEVRVGPDALPLI